jgi:hypothetical protein
MTCSYLSIIEEKKCLTLSSLNQFAISEFFILVFRLISATVASSSVAVLNWLLPICLSFTGGEKRKSKSENKLNSTPIYIFKSHYVINFTFLVHLRTHIPVCFDLADVNGYLRLIRKEAVYMLLSFKVNIKAPFFLRIDRIGRTRV